MPTMRRGGFSVVELLVAIGVLSLLLALLLPAVQNVRAAASRTSCLSNMRQLGLALQNYENSFGSLPPEALSFAPPTGKRFGAAISWRAAILPYLDHQMLWEETVKASRLDAIAYRNPPHIASTTVVKELICPADSRLSDAIIDPANGVTAAYTSYLGIAGRHPGERGNPRYYGVFVGLPKGTRFADIIDGTSNTLAVGERPPPDSLENGWWYSCVCSYAAPATTGPCRGPAPALPMDMQGTGLNGGCLGPFSYGPGRLENPCDRFHFWSLHSGGANFLFADGSARFISYNAKNIMPALATRAGGEVVAVSE